MPPPGATWHPWPFNSDAPGAIISHRDTGPWNIMARDGLPVAFIDWVTAGPADPLEEIAATAWLWAITWRARSAAWMVRHRSLLASALT